jgi:methionine-rich copper-binding protein CopC
MQLPGRRAVLIGAVVLVGVAVLTVLLLARPPGGTLLAANPAQNSSMPSPPQTIALTFSSDVTQAHIGVSKATIGEPVIAGSTVQQPVRSMAAGRHLVTYHVVTQAGDEIIGTLAFTVTGSGTGPVTDDAQAAPPTTPAVSPAEADAADRLTESLQPAPAEAEDQPDPAILALSSGHDHGSIDPATGFVLAVNVVVLLVIGFLSVRRRIRLRRARSSS